MSRKSKGISAERELLHRFWGNGWACIRVAGSGSMGFPSPDLLAGNAIRRLAIECKSINDDKKYFSQDDIDKISEFAGKFGAEAWFAVKFLNVGWFFISLDDLDKTKSNFVVSLGLAKNKGLSFDELIGKF
jgi:Holliday junction resolvase